MIKDDRNYHQRLQEFCDCYLESDPKKELVKTWGSGMNNFISLISDSRVIHKKVGTVLLKVEMGPWGGGIIQERGCKFLRSLKLNCFRTS
jgi:hypothetical protein